MTDESETIAVHPDQLTMFGQVAASDQGGEGRPRKATPDDQAAGVVDGKVAPLPDLLDVQS